MNKRNAESAAAQENGKEGEEDSGSGTSSGAVGSDDDGDISLGAASKSLTAMLDSGSERLRNPFADDEDDDVDADEDEDDDDDDDDDEDVGLNGGDVGRVGLGWNRGGWWRSMVTRDKGAAKAGASGSGSAGFDNEKFGDGRDSSSDGGNSSGEDGASGRRAVAKNDDGLDDDDEEFGDFAMPEATKEDADDDNDAGKTAEGNAESGERETTLFKPLALHPGNPTSSGAAGTAGTSNTAGGSLWRLGFLGTNTASGTADASAESTKQSAPSNDDELEVLGEDGHRVARVTEAAHRRSIEDPDEDEVVV